MWAESLPRISPLQMMDSHDPIQIYRSNGKQNESSNGSEDAARMMVTSDAHTPRIQSASTYNCTASRHALSQNQIRIIS